MSSLKECTWRAWGISSWLSKNGYNNSPAFIAKSTAAFLKSKNLPYTILETILMNGINQLK